MKKYFILALLSASILACAGLGPPKPTTSDYFTTIGGGILYFPEKDQFNFSLSMKPVWAIERVRFADAIFENPVNKNEPLIESVVIQVGAKEVLIVSPPVSDFKRFKHYKVEVRIYADEGKTQYIASHVQSIQSRAKPKAIKKLFGK